jgi:hypothetical protein
MAGPLGAAGPFGPIPRGLLRSGSPSRGTSVPPLRRSARLAGEPPDHEFGLWVKHGWTPEGIEIDSTVKVNRKTGTLHGDWAYRVNKHSRRKAFYPGQIILATDAHPQTVLDKKLDDPNVAQTACGPTFAKLRAMIVIYHTFNGLLCLPMYTVNEGVTLPAARYAELASISNDKRWDGKTPWASLPLRMKVWGGKTPIQYSLVELLRPVHVLTASRIIDIGFMCGGEYAKLLRLHLYRELMAKRMAYQTYQETYSPSLEWQPTRGQRQPFTVAENRMQHKTHMRW